MAQISRLGTGGLCALLIFLLIFGFAVFRPLQPAFAQSFASADVQRDKPGQVIKPGQQVHVDVELALVNVNVTDPYNRIVTGLDADNFRIFENNIEQEVVSLSSEDAPISIGIILDHSRSIANKFANPN